MPDTQEAVLAGLMYGLSEDLQLREALYEGHEGEWQFHISSDLKICRSYA